MAEYKVESSMPTGKSNPQFGSEYYVKFYESEASFALWFKAQPVEGQIVNGDIEGTKFKKEKKEWNPNGGSSPATTQSAPAATKPAWKDNSDGMRQGMCFNNAANYVNAVASEPVEAQVWADTVYKYANALYLKGDLGGNK